MILPQFREFTLWLRSAGRPKVPENTLVKLYRASARHKVAKRFRDLRIDKGSDDLVRGYSAGLQLFLCYSAAEAMGAAIGFHVSRWVVRDDSLQAPLRRLAGPLLTARDGLKESMREKVSIFVDGKDDNVRVVATALRHLVAHGDFTPSGTGAMTKSGAKVIRRLGSLLLIESERQFAAWFEKLAGK